LLLLQKQVVNVGLVIHVQYKMAPSLETVKTGMSARRFNGLN